MTLPTDEQVKKRLGELLDAKDYKKAAQLILYYCFCKTDPDELANMLIEKAKEYKRLAAAKAEVKEIEEKHAHE